MRRNLSPPPVPPQVLAVVGPTASGKTALAIRLAELLETEIISADSMQMYRGMEIGTGAPSPEDRARVRHHFIGILEPSESMSAGRFEIMARKVVEDLKARGKPAILVGGSGLYIRALIDGLFSGPGADAALRERLAEEAEADGVAALYTRLKSVDPNYAEVIAETDLRRIIRALEVYEQSGRPFSELHAENRYADPFETEQVAINWPRETLYERIETRVDAMIADGLLDEVRRLIDNGYESHLQRLKSLGYRELLRHLHGEISLEDAVAETKKFTRRYAKRQLTWFRADPRIQWIEATRVESYAFTLAQSWPEN